LLSALLGLLIGFVGSIPLAGPIALLVFNKGIEKRYSEGVAIALGAALPEAMYCGLAFFGFEYFLVRYLWLEPVSKLLGAIIMVVLGIMFLISKAQSIPKNQVSITVKIGGRWVSSFFSGLTIAAINPVLIATWSGVAAIVFSVLGNLTPFDMIAFSAMVGVGIFAWFGVMLLLMKRFQHNFKPETLAKTVKVFGGLLIALGLWMLYGGIMGAIVWGKSLS
jgi:threonine/homoserine/homoserine lactone efflux protein